LLVWPVPRGVSVIPRAVSLRVSLSQSTGILGIPLPALLSNTANSLRIWRTCREEEKKRNTENDKKINYGGVVLHVFLDINEQNLTHVWVIQSERRAAGPVLPQIACAHGEPNKTKETM